MRRHKKTGGKMNKRQKRRHSRAPRRVSLDRVKSSLRRSSYEHLRQLADAAGTSASDVIRELLSRATVRVPEPSRTIQVLLPVALMDKYRLASQRSGFPVAALVRTTLEHELGRRE